MGERFDAAASEEDRAVVAQAIVLLADGDADGAAERLREHFGSVCERERPRLQDAAHPAACHLHEQPGRG